MAWHDADSWLTQALSPNLSTIALTLAIALVLPILLHSFLYRKAAAATGLPTFLLVGPSGGGKTAFTTLTERGTVPTTHTSTTPLSIEALLPSPHVPASSHYRSPGDPAFERARRFSILDTPGHGKLRNFATSTLDSPTAHVRGIIFVVDAAAIDEESNLNEAAEYLHDVLLSLQKRHTTAKTSKGPKEIPVLIAANKMDLFTALPASAVKSKLEKAISAVRNNRAKALRDAGAKLTGEDDVDEEKDWLGEGGEGRFEFDQMREIGTTVDVVGGNVSQGKNVGDVAGWWSWMGEHL